MTYQELFLRAVRVQSSLQQAQRSLSSALQQLSAYEAELEVATQNHENMIDAIAKFKLVIDSFSTSHIKEIESLVTLALQTIFTDRDYTFKINVSDKRNAKQAEFYLVDDGNEIPLNKYHTAAGILTVVGLTLQLYFINYLKLSPIITLDEGLSQLSTDYLPGLFEFFEKLKEQKKYIFILISHDPRFLEFANRIYQVNSGTYTLLGDTT